MKLFQWVYRVIKDALLLPVGILKQAWRRATSRSSLLRENHELRYQVELYKIQNKKLVDSLEAMKDENVLLWQHMDEMKEAEKAIMKSITDELQDNILRTLTPIGDA
jgi:hypothetical protein